MVLGEGPDDKNGSIQLTLIATKDFLKLEFVLQAFDFELELIDYQGDL